jgi:hypothetical protein
MSGRIVRGGLRRYPGFQPQYARKRARPNGLPSSAGQFQRVQNLGRRAIEPDKHQAIDAADDGSLRQPGCRSTLSWCRRIGISACNAPATKTVGPQNSLFQPIRERACATDTRASSPAPFPTLLGAPRLFLVPRARLDPVRGLNAETLVEAVLVMLRSLPSWTQRGDSRAMGQHRKAKPHSL